MAPEVRTTIPRRPIQRSGSCAYLFANVWTDEREPVPILRQLSPHGLVERVLNTTRDRPWFTAADDAAVHVADRGHFDGGAGEEQLVGAEHVVHGDRRDRRLDAEVLRDLEDRGARHAHQNAGVLVVGDDAALFYDEQILAGAFGDEPLRVEQQRFVETAPLRLVHGARRVDVLTARLGPRRDRAVVELADRRHRDADAGVGVREVLAGRYRGNRHGDRALRGPDAQRAGVEEGDRAQVRGFQLVGANDLEARLGDRVLRIWNRQIVKFGGLVEALQVRVEPEDSRAVGGRVRLHPLEDAGAVLQAVRQHVHFCVAPGNQRAVEPDCLGWRKAHNVLQRLNIYRDGGARPISHVTCPNFASRSGGPRPT